jgi:hypothetical protein
VREKLVRFGSACNRQLQRIAEVHECGVQTMVTRTLHEAHSLSDEAGLTQTLSLSLLTIRAMLESPQPLASS